MQRRGLAGSRGFHGRTAAKGCSRYNENQFLSGHFPHHELQCVIVLVARLRPLFRAAVTLSYGPGRVKTIAEGARGEANARLPMSNLLSVILIFFCGVLIYAFRRRIIEPLRAFEARNARRRT